MALKFFNNFSNIVSTLPPDKLCLLFSYL
uniref:Uncharacterized protein n=1 Tax=Anguilla anguilla TaxID=7936 RepID=A0A0E9TCQ1_ANGAN